MKPEAARECSLKCLGASYEVFESASRLRLAPVSIGYFNPS